MRYRITVKKAQLIKDTKGCVLNCRRDIVLDKLLNGFFGCQRQPMILKWM